MAMAGTRLVLKTGPSILAYQSFDLMMNWRPSVIFLVFFLMIRYVLCDGRWFLCLAFGLLFVDWIAFSVDVARGVLTHAGPNVKNVQ